MQARGHDVSESRARVECDPTLARLWQFPILAVFAATSRSLLNFEAAAHGFYAALALGSTDDVE